MQQPASKCLLPHVDHHQDVCVQLWTHPERYDSEAVSLRTPPRPIVQCLTKRSMSAVASGAVWVSLAGGGHTPQLRAGVQAGQLGEDRPVVVGVVGQA